MSVGRLYDYLTDRYSAYFTKPNMAFQDATVYEISNIAEMCSQRKKTQPSTDFPLVAPPFPSCFFEFDMSRFFGQYVSKIEQGRFRTAKSGFMLVTEDVATDTPEARYLLAMNVLADVAADITPEIKASMQMAPWAQIRWIGTITWWCIDMLDGEPLARGESMMVFIKATGGLTNPAIYMPSPRVVQRDEVNLMGTLFEQAAEPVWEALSLLNCKNIVQDVQLPSQTRAQRRRGERPGVKYRVIKVVPFATYRRYLRTGEKVPDTMVPYHLIPGKLCDYREKGLFGRYKGLFYRPPHARGSLRHGATVKDYDVQKPKVEYPNA